MTRPNPNPNGMGLHKKVMDKLSELAFHSESRSADLEVSEEGYLEGIADAISAMESFRKDFKAYHRGHAPLDMNGKEE